MVELKPYKYKLYNRDALRYLDNILVISGRIYNHCIALHRRYYGIYHKMLNKYQLQKHLYRRSKGKRGSLRTLQKLHEKVSNQRSDMHWKLARQMCRDYDVMVFETLDLANLSKKHKKSMYDFGFNTFLNIIEYVAYKTGKTVMYADKWYPSSQLCSECGYQNHELKDVSIRHWICPKCGAEHDRDRNAAINLCKVGASTFGICCSQ